jgi:hypothetical protein|tara:strand:+ start:37 stop:390 length:354 start_codon:yes stop_codon:yes gene_type:complete
MARKLKKLLKKAAPLLAIAGLGKAFMNARNNRLNSQTADMPRSMVPMSKRMVQGLNFPVGTNLSGFNTMANAGMRNLDAAGIDNFKSGGMVVKTGEKTKKLKKKKSIQVRGFGKARR